MNGRAAQWLYVLVLAALLAVLCLGVFLRR